MDLFSRATPSPHRDQIIVRFGTISSAAVPVSRGLYLAAIIGLVIILAVGSILAVQLRPYTAPPEKLLGGDTNQPRLVDSGSPIETHAIIGEGGECNGQDA